MHIGLITNLYALWELVFQYIICLFAYIYVIVKWSMACVVQFEIWKHFTSFFH